jgi:hypothetical protein
MARDNEVLRIITYKYGVLKITLKGDRDLFLEIIVLR